MPTPTIGAKIGVTRHFCLQSLVGIPPADVIEAACSVTNEQMITHVYTSEMQ